MKGRSSILYRTIAVLAALWVAFAAAAQNRIKVEVRPDALVSQDENFQVTFTIEGTGTVSQFKWEPGDDFHLVWGPARSTSSSTTIVNGRRETTSRQSFSYTLRARRAGTLPIAQASATVDGTTIYSELASVRVIEGEKGETDAESAAPSESSSDRGSATSRGQDIFIRMIPSKRRVTVGEPFRFEIKLYTKLDLSGIDGAKLPSFDNFSKQDDAIGEIQFHREEYGGTIYYVSTIAAYTLTPLKAGTIPVDAAELSCIYLVRNASTGDPLEDFFGTGTRQVRKTLRAPGMDIEVSPLPGGAPASFSGAVGSYKLSASLSADRLSENTAGSLSVDISGSGNIAMLAAPEVNLPQGFDTYGTESKFDAKGAIAGVQHFSYTFVPRTDGEFRIGPVEFTYFDTDKRSYVTLREGPFTLTVDRDSTALALTPAYQQGAAPRLTGARVESKSTLRYIHFRRPSDFGQRRSFWVTRPLYWVVLGLLLLALLIYLPASAAVYRRRADLVGTRNRRAAKLAKSRLKTAYGYLRKNLPTAFYEELHRAMLGYASDKLSLDMAALNREDVREALLSGGVSEAVAGDFTGLMDACEYARYAPGGDAAATMREQYDAAVRILSDIDASMRKSVRKAPAGKLSALLLLALLPQALQAAPDAVPAAASVPASAAVSASVPAPADNLWDAGVAAYQDGRYADAVRAWQDLAAADPANAESADLWYNIGNAAYQAGDLATAVLGYERALKRDPSMEDARANLDFISSQLDQFQIVPEFALTRALRVVCRWMGANTWAFLATLFFVLALAGALFFFRSGRRGWRIAGFYGGIAALLLFGACLSFSVWQYRMYTDRGEAVVVVGTATVRDAPSSVGSNAGTSLHAGTKVRVLDAMNGWTKVRLPNGDVCWIRDGDIEII